jgi:hypothetical protein
MKLLKKGTLQIVYKNGGTVGSKWSVARVAFGDEAGVVFTMTDAGQGQYTSTDLSGTGYAGELRFQAAAILQ